MNLIIKSNFLHSININQIDLLENTYLIISKGVIENIITNEIKTKEIESYLQKYDNTNYEYLDYSEYIITPGFIDLHTHLPQVFARGLGDLELMEWLEKYIFVEELKFKDIDYAKFASEVFFDNLIKNGTTTACVYTSTFKGAADISFKSAINKKLRVFMGNTLMDLPNIQGLYLSLKENIDNIEYLFDKYHNSGLDKVNYMLTPRFAGSCSPELMEYVAKFAKKNNVKIQTHLSENFSEIDYMKSLYPKFENYTHIYDTYGLLQEYTVLAHSIYLSDDEVLTLKEHKCSIAHCPNSNRFLSSGIMKTKEYITKELNIGLGTDIGAGYSFSILNEMKESVENSKLLNIMKNISNERQSQKITVENAFYLATLGGAKSLGLENQLGNFEIGKYADFCVFDMKLKSIKLNTQQYSEDKNLKESKLSKEILLSNLIYKSEIQTPINVFIGGERVI